MKHQYKITVAAAVMLSAALAGGAAVSRKLHKN